MFQSKEAREAFFNSLPPVQKDPNPASADGSALVNILSVAFIVVGAVCFIGGLVLASDRYGFNWMMFLGGLLGGMFSFGWAVVLRVCSVYLKKNKG